MKTAVVTGASGFIGYHLVNELLEQDVFVYAIVRPESRTAKRLDHFKDVKMIALAMQEIERLPSLVDRKIDLFYHLAWGGERDDFFGQILNVDYTLKALEAAKKIGCGRFIATGSQAEYGLCDGMITEETLPSPNTAYGSAKLAACYLSKFRAEQLQMEWIWPRIFSVYGEYDNVNALIPYLIRCLSRGEVADLTDGSQNWDYLDGGSAAELLFLLGERGHTNQIYNLASGDVHPLKYFIEEIRKKMIPNQELSYGKKKNMVMSISPCIEKIRNHTGWIYKFNFSTEIDRIIKQKWY